MVSLELRCWFGRQQHTVNLMPPPDVGEAAPAAVELGPPAHHSVLSHSQRPPEVPHEPALPRSSTSRSSLSFPLRVATVSAVSAASPAPMPATSEPAAAPVEQTMAVEKHADKGLAGSKRKDTERPKRSFKVVAQAALAIRKLASESRSASRPAPSACGKQPRLLYAPACHCGSLVRRRANALGGQPAAAAATAAVPPMPLLHTLHRCSPSSLALLQTL